MPGSSPTHPAQTWVLLLSAIVIPVMAVVFFAVLEAAYTQDTIWRVLSKTGSDLCTLSVGIVGGMFLNAQLQNQIGQGAAPIVGIAIVLLNLILASTVMLVQRRFQTMSLDTKAYISIFLGVITIAVPTGILAWIGGS